MRREGEVWTAGVGLFRMRKCPLRRARSCAPHLHSVYRSSRRGGHEARAKSEALCRRHAQRGACLRHVAPLASPRRLCLASPLPTAAAPRLLHFEKEDRGSRWRRCRDASARVPRNTRRAAAIARLPAPRDGRTHRIKRSRQMRKRGAWIQIEKGVVRKRRKWFNLLFN